MIRSGLFSIFLVFAFSCSKKNQQDRPRPKLVVTIVIDQCRADLFQTHRDVLSGKNGLASLVKDGAYFPRASYEILQSMTCPGHATISTGAYPRDFGFSLNSWPSKSWPPEETPCTASQRVQVVGSGGQMPTELGVSPERLRTSTFSDELKLTGRKSKVISLAIKDRAAVMLGGHAADEVYWMKGHEWITSTHYMPSLPDWVVRENEKLANRSDQIVDWDWSKASSPNLVGDQGSDAGSAPGPGPVLKGDKQALITPYGTQVTVDLALAALEAHGLGVSPGRETDFLFISLSSHDLVGHRYGPNHASSRAMLRSESEAISRLVTEIFAKVGRDKTLIVITGDHGVAPAPSFSKSFKLPAGHLEREAVSQKVLEVLKTHFATEITKWQKQGRDRKPVDLVLVKAFNVYLHPEFVSLVVESGKTKSLSDLVKRHLLLSFEEELAEVISHWDLETKRLSPELVRRSFVGESNGEFVLVPRPFFIEKGAYATHLTHYNYDAQVPLLFVGLGIPAREHSKNVKIVDIAETISFLLGTVSPASSQGQVLDLYGQSNDLTTRVR